MKFLVPYILTFISFMSYSMLLGTYSYIHKDLVQLFQISKTQLGVINGLLAVGSSISVMSLLFYSSAIKQKVVTYYVWCSISYMLPFCIIIFLSLFYQHPPKILLYLIVFVMGISRSILSPSILIMLKIHKQIYDRENTMNQNNYKLVLNLSSVSYDVGMGIGFFIINWLEYSMNFKWQYIVILSVTLMLSTSTVLLFSMRSYLEEDDGQPNLSTNMERPKSQLNKNQTSLFNFFILLDKRLSIKLYVLNTAIMGSLHLAFSFVLPSFFYSSGFKGKEGYLTAIHSLFIVIGAWILAISDYVIQKFADNKNYQDQQYNKQNSKVSTIPKKQAISSYIFSISLFFFAITLILLTIISFQSQSQQAGGFQQPNLTIQIILMCSLGFFFGGPLKSYYSYRSIKVMGQIQQIYQNEVKNDAQFDAIKSGQQKILQKQPLSMFERFNQHRIQIGTSLLTASRLLNHLLSIFMFTLSFFLLERYLSYVMVFLALLAIIILVVDITLNANTTKREQTQLKQNNNKYVKIRTNLGIQEQITPK